jgi:hypothetical protein
MEPHAVELAAPGPPPPFVIVSPKPMAPEAIRRLQELWSRAGATGKTLILDAGLTFYQWTGSRYEPVEAVTPPPPSQ